ncbi:MAG TPA: M1 family aminopeptidase [Pyrinomonadaceae bacterium]|jgi:aminopeptidase N|nr:M1 family aminopeptidase [Pyrinomonadaceae bacterium]
MLSGIISRRATAPPLLLLLLLACFVTNGINSSTLASQRLEPGSKAGAGQNILPRRSPPQGPVQLPPARTFDVQHYLIRTRFDAQTRTVIGDETITLKPLNAGFRSFALDASDMKIESVALSPSQALLEWTQPPDKLLIALDRAYGPGDTISVRILYRANPQRGLYFVPARQGTSISKPAQIWTQGEPEENHHWFPCYDYPDDKATSEQYITTSNSEIAISNGALVETAYNADGTRTFHWVMKQPHSTYLTSLVVGDYVKLTDAYKSVPLEYYTYRGTERVALRAFSQTPEMMSLFTQVLNYKYPYDKYAQTIVSAFFSGGMENITATTHSDSEILAANDAAGGVTEATEDLLAHELSHSWFGDLVTCKSWKHLWLNEGFATFMEAVFREHKEGRDAYLLQMRQNARLYLLEDRLRYRRPIVYDRYRNPSDIFDATLYQKGGLIIHMLREAVGDALFWKSLNRYLDEHKYGLVETADLQRAFEQTSEKRLDWFFDQWVYKAGYPELRVRYSYRPASRLLTLSVEQTQLADDTTPEVFRLPVEIEVTTAGGRSRVLPIVINSRKQLFTFKLEARPLLIRFDRRSSIIKKLDFPQPEAMVAYQLAHSPDALGRIEAAEALARIRASRTQSAPPGRVAAKSMRLNP